MAELGSGNGTGYPGALDTDSSVEVNSPAAGKTKARAEVVNDFAAAIVAVQTELGTDPAGSLTNVKTFLQTEHNTDGTHAGVTATKVTTSSAAGAVTFNCSSGTFFFHTLTENVTGITISNPASGMAIQITFKQAAAGGPYTVAGWAATVKLAGAAFSMTATASTHDTLQFRYDGTNWIEIGRVQDAR